MFHARMRLLAAGVSAIALGTGLSTAALAATVEGVRQDSAGTIAINLFEVSAGETAAFGTGEQVSNPGGPANAQALILCAESATCADPGALEQFASGVKTASNVIVVDGSLAIAATAIASGASATASAKIDTAIWQRALSGGLAADGLEVSGTLGVLASAAAIASEGNADAHARVSHPVTMAAIGETAAEIEVANSGTITLAAVANAEAAGVATDPLASNAAFAEAFIAGVTAAAIVTGADGSAAVTVSNVGTIAVAASAHASATGAARAQATALHGLVGSAKVAGDGNADVALSNSGEIAVAAYAAATGGHTGSAIAIVAGGLIAVASGHGVGDAAAGIVNSGSVLVSAEAVGDATTNGSALAIAVTAIFDVAHAATGDAMVSLDNSGSIALIGHAEASGLNVRATALAGGGLSGAAVFQSAAAASGSAHAVLDNSGEISISVAADAKGAGVAYAFAIGGPGVFQNAFATGGDATADVINSGSLTISAKADATADSTAVAHALFYNGLVMSAYGGPGANAFGNLDNEGTITITAAAHASGANYALASAFATDNIGQLGFIYSGEEVALDLNNSGVIELLVGGLAVGDAGYARATVAKAVFQNAVALQMGNASADMTNSGTINVAALAKISSANVDAFSGTAQAVASAQGYSQIASAVAVRNTVTTTTGGAIESRSSFGGAGQARLLLNNSGSIAVAATALADGGGVALASGVVRGGTQEVDGTDVAIELRNSGTLSAIMNALAAGATAAAARATAFGPEQNANATEFFIKFIDLPGGTIAFASGQGPLGPAAVSIDNTGSIDINAAAIASAGGGAGTSTGASANAVASGVAQFVSGSEASAAVSNSGSLTVAAQSKAASSGNAGANAGAQGIYQGLTTFGSTRVDYSTSMGAFLSSESTTYRAGPATAVLDNAGEIVVAASAVASAPDGAADAAANALGIGQSVVGTLASISIDNRGVLAVGAKAAASGMTGLASAVAAGITQGSSTGTELVIEIVNSGTIEVGASAKAAQVHGATAFASAIGVTGRGVGFGAAELSFDNNGSLDVAAVANADGGDVAGASAFARGFIGSATNVAVNVGNEGEVIVAARAAANGASSWSVASAMGIMVAPSGGTLSGAITNEGTIDVSAIVGSDAGLVSAVGIRAAGQPGVAEPGSVLTINNSGNILVRVSSDGGETFRRGMALDVAGAPNPTVINLFDGIIYGNIDIGAADIIAVIGGETLFNGIVDPECLPASFVAGDAPALSSCGVGSLNILGGGTLVLLDPRVSGDPDLYDGPAYAFVETLTLDPTGTIAFALEPAAGGAQPAGSYPQVFADVANLDGTLEARFAPAGGLFADNYSWHNVIDANHRNGTFDACIIGGAYSGSLFLTFGCDYDDQANVDLTLARVAFDDVLASNNNGTAVGEGLECIYDTTLTGGIADLLGDLFLFTDPVNYNIALNQLAGSSYANYLQSFPSLGVHYNDLLAKATDCEIPALAGSVLECRASAPIHVWGQLDYQFRKADGDNEAGTTRSKRFTGLLGVDASVGNSAIVGVSAGSVTNNTKDRQFGDKIEASGMQVGAYGVFDPGQFYVKAMTTYSWYDGDSERDINFVGLAPGATFAASQDGDPDVRMWTFGLHGGYRMGLGGNSVLTPYLNYDYVNARMKEFIEGATSGAALHLDDNSAKHSFLSGGVKWATQMGGVFPEVNLGYRSRFSDKRTDISQAFLCQTDTCAFDVVSAGQKRGNFLAGLSVGGKMGPVDLRIGYEGEFNSDITSHSGNFKFVLPLGGRAAPPPPPPAPVMAPPPPPPPVEVAPPPPPAPVERGERGQ